MAGRRLMPIKPSQLAAALLFVASPAAADELFVGLLAHDVDSPLTKGGFEEGADLELGWRGGRIEGLKVIGAPSPYAFVAVSSDGETNVAAAGFSWKIGGRLYLRPGLGLAVHDRSSHVIHGRFRGDLGSRILFEPELGLGYRLSDRLSLEASWVHVSHGGLLSPQNPGMDAIGLRLGYRLR
jgi:lipid A 3-O-deacylase